MEHLNEIGKLKEKSQLEKLILTRPASTHEALLTYMVLLVHCCSLGNFGCPPGRTYCEEY